jgi:hypothetical protein
MADKTMLAVGGVAVAGLLYFMSKGDSESTTLGDTQATSFVGIGGGGTADNRSEKVVNPSEFLDDCAITSETDDGSSSCETPLYKANETITLKHPLSATNSDYSLYKFTVKIEADILTSMASSAFESAPASQMLGDYTISVERSGGWQEDRRWTANQNPDFNGSLTLNGLITKGNANDPAASVAPTWEQCLNAFGGYMPNKVGALGEGIYLRSGSFTDVGEFKYKKQGADGEAYPVSVNKFGLTMDGNIIPLYAQMEIKCASGGWKLSGSPVQVTLANSLPAGDVCSTPCFPSVLPTSGVALGCELPTVSISYPSRINIVCHSEVQDCSDRATTSTGGSAPDEIWNLNPAITVPTTMQKGNWETDSGRVWGILFDGIGTPKIYQDAQGWYVKYSNSTSKTYINSVLPGFKAAYTRQSVECDCPSDTMLEGTKFTMLDKFSCPSGGILSGIFGGSAEWKDTYCGGLKPDYGCTDARATNYNSSKVKDPTDNDVCNPKYCNYGLTQILPECQGSGGGLGGGGLGDLGGGTTTPPASGNNDADERPSPPPRGGGSVGVGVGGGTGGVFRFAETTLTPSKLVNTSHSFLNW